MNLEKFAERVALLDEVSFNINTGNELREHEVSNVKSESYDLPTDFHKRTVSQRKAWIKGMMQEFIKENSDLLFREEYAIQGGTFFGKLMLLVVKKIEDDTVIDPQDHEQTK